MTTDAEPDATTEVKGGHEFWHGTGVFTAHGTKMCVTDHNR
jgi:hypothetical protein